VKNYYEILGLKRTSSEKEVNRRTYELGKSLHPKKAKSKVLDTKKFEEIIEAHSVIGDTETKEVYDWVLDHELGNKQLRDFALAQHKRELEIAINHGISRGRSYAKEPFWVFKDDFSNSMWWSRWNIFSLWPF
jgi:DnaJ-class molecular chaperone